MQTLDAKVESLLNDLPDERSARLFLDRVQQEQPRTFKKLASDPSLLSDVLALVAWSPLLGTTLEQNPDYIGWLARERVDSRVRTRDELKESLGRFALTHSTLSSQVVFARFRRRELLRIYLHDIRRSHTLVETTEELSNLADAILDYALSQARQELDNRYGAPLRDERGRIATAEFCIIALGKLGSCELNYASDIDLVFVYSDDGNTSGSGARGKVSNREYFIKLAEIVAKLVGQPAGEGAAYRVDLRLRPHGRDGALACSIEEAVRYYSTTAQAWELQALIRSRAAAGSNAVFQHFSSAVEERIYREDVSVAAALESVRVAKQKIDQHIERKTEGFNVKLQRGGIREIEFIAQALQLAHGGGDEWLRVSHTLISLGRLADRDLITEQERSELSDAYLFLRTLEHRLQMEHGLQTHIVPLSAEQRELVAKRMGFSGESTLQDFDQALSLHTTNVRRAYDRVFAGIDRQAKGEKQDRRVKATGRATRRDETLVETAVDIFLAHRNEASPEARAAEAEMLTLRLTEAAQQTINPHRAVMLTSRVAASLDKTDWKLSLASDSLETMVRVAGASEFLGELIAANPKLIDSLNLAPGAKRRDYRALLRSAIDAENSYAAELTALRREWSKALIDIAVRDVGGRLTLAESNALQTELAVASINVSYLIARRTMAGRFGKMVTPPRLSVLALGRLASGGVDYGSDLDIILVYDSLVASPVAKLTQDEAYARLSELMIGALSSVTRGGYLYRVDLRLRPNGKNGPLVTSADSFLDYLRQHSDIWEWLAYVKLRAVAGDLELGRMVETHARHAIHEKAREVDQSRLKTETRRVRELLEREKGTRGRHGRRRADIDIKYGPGGMLDVYFAARYLQLRDDVADEGDDRSTRATLERLEAMGSLTAADFDALSGGYELLRAVDHQLRVIAGKKAALPSVEHPLFNEIAVKLRFGSAEDLRERLATQMAAIRAAYLRITGED